MYTNKKKVHKLSYCQHRPKLKVNLFYCYFDQTRFAEFFQRTFFRLVIFFTFSCFLPYVLVFYWHLFNTIVNNLRLSLSTLQGGPRLQLTIWFFNFWVAVFNHVLLTYRETFCRLILCISPVRVENCFFGPWQYHCQYSASAFHA